MKKGEIMCESQDGMMVFRSPNKTDSLESMLAGGKSLKAKMMSAAKAEGEDLYDGSLRDKRNQRIFHADYNYLKSSQMFASLWAELPDNWKEIKSIVQAGLSEKLQSAASAAPRVHSTEVCPTGVWILQCACSASRSSCCFALRGIRPSRRAVGPATVCSPP
jgi:hypothetical protein